MDYLAQANAGVAGLHPYQAGKPIEELERELGISNCVKLASNENPLGLSPKAQAAISAALKDLTRYPDANGYYLKHKLGDCFDLDPAGITLGNGSNEVIDLLFHTFVGQGDEVIYAQYSFIVYALATQAHGAKAVVVPARDWGHDLDAMLAAITDKTKLICIANPNNPTGTVLPPAELEAFLAKVPSEILVVLDEAYNEYMDPALRAPSADWVKRFPNLVVTRTFSKAYGLAGLRLGYALSTPELASVLNRVREPFNCNSLALVAAQATLDDADYLAEAVRLNRSEMGRYEAYFSARGLGYIPSSGNFITVDLARPAGPVYEALLREGVIVRPIAGYGMPNHLRVSIGTMAENDRFFAALDKVLG
ncbi:histidinol-phosphate transaminase [Pseudaeromonas paramecii]|uniref:Histidinol-phosphate aminotransferase n=1 Tax=Pseudaeromonas paramecii TaxID=2138166 RepID=A0ABP8Q3R6_9GAMM